MKKEKVIKSNIYFLLIICVVLTACKTLDETKEKDPIKDLPVEIGSTYANGMVESENVAIKIALVIWSERYPNEDFDNYPAFDVKSIANDKVWYISASLPTGGRGVLRKSYHMNINKNTGEILNNWVVK